MFLLGTQASGMDVGLNKVKKRREVHATCGARSRCLVMGVVIWKVIIYMSRIDLGVKSYRSFQRAAAAFCGQDFPCITCLFLLTSPAGLQPQGDAAPRCCGSSVPAPPFPWLQPPLSQPILQLTLGTLSPAPALPALPSPQRRPCRSSAATNPAAARVLPSPSRQPSCSTKSIPSPRLVCFLFLLEHPFGLASFLPAKTALPASAPALGSGPAQVLRSIFPHVTFPLASNTPSAPLVHRLLLPAPGFFVFPDTHAFDTHSHSSSSI